MPLRTGRPTTEEISKAIIRLLDANIDENDRLLLIKTIINHVLEHHPNEEAMQYRIILEVLQAVSSHMNSLYNRKYSDFDLNVWQY